MEMPFLNIVSSMHAHVMSIHTHRHVLVFELMRILNESASAMNVHDDPLSCDDD